MFSVLASDVGEEGFPLILEELLDARFVLVGNRGELKRVVAKLLQVIEVEVPGEISNQIVESDAW